MISLQGALNGACVYNYIRVLSTTWVMASKLEISDGKREAHVHTRVGAHIHTRADTRTCPGAFWRYGAETSLFC